MFTASCADPEADSWLDLPPISWRGDYLEFGTDVDTMICPQTLPLMDEFTGAALDHIRAETQLPIRYYYLEEDLPRYGFGCHDAWGCASGPNGRATLAARELDMRHELVHGTSAHFFHRVLDEGLAVYFGTNLHWWGIAEPPDIHAAFDDVEGDGGALHADFYPVAGHFVGYLIERYGLPRVVALIESTRPGMPLAELTLLAAEHLGADLPRVIDDYATTQTGCEVAEFSPSWFECDYTPSSIPILSCERGGDAEPIELDVTCEGGASGGGASGVQEGKVWRDILVDVSEPVIPVIYVHEGHPVEIIVHGCGSGCGTSFARVESTSAEPGPLFGGFQFEPGLSLIRVVKPFEAAGTVRFSISMSCSGDIAPPR